MDTHTGGEITRMVLGSDIGLDDMSASQQQRVLAADFDWLRTSLTSEPRGSAYAVGAVVTPPHAAADVANSANPIDTADNGEQGRIVFFNNAGYLGMCGHGLLGVIESLRHLGLIRPGQYDFDTPAGPVTAHLLPDHQVRFTGVVSRVTRTGLELPLDDGTTVRGDVAYGGNWFFLGQDDRVASASLTELTDLTEQIRDQLIAQSIRGDDGHAVDHIELCCPLADPSEVGCRSFVLCPGGHHDRSPCGTGTSAKLACLAKRNQLPPGEQWIQESVTQSRFIATYQPAQGGVRATIDGRAHVTAETMQIYDPADPLRLGFAEASQ